ncbi:MAG: hypothetical protein ABGX25_02710 [Nautiliaceae bacterium]
MKIVLKYKIENDGDLLFAKIDLNNFLKDKKNEYKNFISFALMEFGTNLLKHGGGGEIWLLEEEGEYLLSALDKGPGIENIEWAVKKGTTSYNNSLGLGLFQISQNSMFDLKIFTSTKKIKGTVVLLVPKTLKKNYCYLVRNYMDIKTGGDFIVKKGKFFLIGDASGHGVSANKSAEFIKKYFLKNSFSCLLINEFFHKLHIKIKENNLRGAVLSIVEVTKNFLLICGVGNIGIIKKHFEKIETFSQKEGIVGEVFSSASTQKIIFDKNTLVVLHTDGIEKKLLYNILQKTDNIYLIAVASVFFSEVMDDRGILIFKGEKNET